MKMAVGSLLIRQSNPTAGKEYRYESAIHILVGNAQGELYNSHASTRPHNTTGPPPGGPGQEPFAWDSSYLMNMGITKVMAARTVFYLLMTARQNN